MSKLKKFVVFLEDYAIVTGELKRYLRPWLSWRYRKDLHRLITYFKIWQCIEEGLDSYTTWRIFLAEYNWSMSYFQRVVSIAGYLGKIRISSVNPYTKQMGLILHKPNASVAVDGNESIIQRRQNECL